MKLSIAATFIAAASTSATSVSTSGVLVSATDGVAPLETRRELCEKCTGDFACDGVEDHSKIGCGSCNGFLACANMASTVTSIGDGSCVGEKACIFAKGVFNIVCAQKQNLPIKFDISVETNSPFASLSQLTWATTVGEFLYGSISKIVGVN
eukprot:scaffold56240_cov38-Cyclotella_meneghiniana.AAC.5